jgi:hypothetical protein
MYPPLPAHSQKGVNEPKIPLATWMEAVVGAVWLDCGGNAVTMADMLVRLGIMKREQVKTQNPKNTAGGAVAKVKAQAKSEVAKVAVASTAGAELAPQVKAAIASEVSSATKGFARNTEAMIERHTDILERRVKALEHLVENLEQSKEIVAPEPASEPMARKTRRRDVMARLKALPAWGIARAFSPSHRKWEVKQGLQNAMPAP